LGLVVLTSNPPNWVPTQHWYAHIGKQAEEQKEKEKMQLSFRAQLTGQCTHIPGSEAAVSQDV